MGFWTKSTKVGDIHISGDPNMPEEDLKTLVGLAEEAVAQYEHVLEKFEHLWKWNPFGSAKGIALHWFNRGYQLRVHEENQRQGAANGR